MEYISDKKKAWKPLGNNVTRFEHVQKNKQTNKNPMLYK